MTPMTCRASASQRSLLVMRNVPNNVKDLIRWRIGHGGAATLADLGNPVSGSPALGLCLYDASASSQPLLARTVLPGGTCNGKPCWKPVGSTGYRYRNRAGTPEGITDMKLRITGAGELHLVAKGRGASLLMPPLGLTAPVLMQLVVSDGAGTRCWESSFLQVLRNDASVFRANGS